MLRIYRDYEDFQNRLDKNINGVTQDFYDSNRGKISLPNSYGCWNCNKCNNCYDCVNCYNCEVCLGCENCKNCIGLIEEKDLDGNEEFF